MEALRQSLQRFISLSESDWQLISEMTIVKKIPKKNTVLFAGDTCRHVYFIKEGLLRLYYIKEGKEFIRQFFFENGFCADFSSFVSQQPSQMFIDTVEDSELLALPHTEMIKLYESSPALCKLGRLVAENTIVSISNRLSSMFLDSPEEQYKKLLQERPKVMQRIPQYMVASYLGITPEALSRIRARL